MKNYANRRVRRKKIDYEMSCGGAYKKETCPWDICDWSWHYFGTEEDIKRQLRTRRYWDGLYMYETESEVDREFRRMKGK